MASVFKRVDVEWRGKTYAIQPERVLGAVAIIEAQFSFVELVRQMQGGNLRMSALAGVYADILQYAGCDTATGEQVYADLFDGDIQVKILSAVQSLLLVMLPPQAVAKHGLMGDLSGNVPAAPTKPKRAARSRRSIKRSSARVE